MTKRNHSHLLPTPFYSQVEGAASGVQPHVGGADTAQGVEAVAVEFVAVGRGDGILEELGAVAIFIQVVVPGPERAAGGIEPVQGIVIC